VLRHTSGYSARQGHSAERLDGILRIITQEIHSADVSY